MKKILKFSGIVILVFVGVILAILVYAYLQTEARLNRIYVVPRDAMPITTGEADLSRGARIFRYRGCLACHGDSLEGKVYLEDPVIGQVATGNLTRGEGGFGATFTDADWIAAIRYGIRPEGTPLLFMPSTEFYFLSDEDLGQVIAYIKSVPPVDHVQAPSSVSLTGRVVMALIPAVTFIPAELIPMQSARPVAPEPGITVVYGEYLTYSCKVCHGLNMSGGKIPAFPSDYPPARNLTWGEGSRLPAWEVEDFIHFMRTGMTHGRHVEARYMPWTSYQYMTDDELRAVWLYLKSLPKLAYGNR